MDGQETLDYCKLLNKTLPNEIRVIAWSPVRPEFSARFNCCRRTYKYFFPRGNLNIQVIYIKQISIALSFVCNVENYSSQKMLEGAQHFVGEHDFRNFCKLDKACRTTMRKIISVEIVANGEDKYDMCHLIINGSSFLWHQIRCIVGVLLLIGQGLEEPDVVKKLLDVEKFPKYGFQIIFFPDNCFAKVVQFDYVFLYSENHSIQWQLTTLWFYTTLIIQKLRVLNGHILKKI